MTGPVRELTTRRTAASRRAAARRRESGDLARGQSGQAAVELIGILPMLVLLALAAGQFLAAGRARELAGHAAEAGAVAMMRHEEPGAAAREALPGTPTRRLRVTVDGRRVRVRLRPAAVMPGIAGLLIADVVAVAGPAR